MLRAAGYRVRSFASGQAFLSAPTRLDDGCILLDLHMPDLGGLDVQQGLRDRSSEMAVIIATGDGDLGAVVQAMNNGAVGFLEQPYAKAQLIGLLERARKERLGEEVRVAAARLAGLNDAERAVLNRMMQGSTNAAIADRLGVRTRTVEIHRAWLMQVTGASTLSMIRVGIVARGSADPPQP